VAESGGGRQGHRRHQLSFDNDARIVPERKAVERDKRFRILPWFIEEREEGGLPLSAILCHAQTLRPYPLALQTSRRWRWKRRYLFRGDGLWQEHHDAISQPYADAEQGICQSYDCAYYRPHRLGRPTFQAVRHSQEIHRRWMRSGSGKPGQASQTSGRTNQRRRIPDHYPQVYGRHAAFVGTG